MNEQVKLQNRMLLTRILDGADPRDLFLNEKKISKKSKPLARGKKKMASIKEANVSEIINVIKPLLAKIKKESFKPEYRDKATDEEAMGLLVARYFGWAGDPILKTTYYALEDSNYHAENETIFNMISDSGWKKRLSGQEEEKVGESNSIKEWKDRLQNVYSDFDEFEEYDNMYGLATRLGFESAEDAWSKNPMIQGSVRPEDYKVVGQGEEK